MPKTNDNGRDCAYTVRR